MSSQFCIVRNKTEFQYSVGSNKQTKKFKNNFATKTSFISGERKNNKQKKKTTKTKSSTTTTLSWWRHHRSGRLDGNDDDVCQQFGMTSSTTSLLLDWIEVHWWRHKRNLWWWWRHEGWGTDDEADERTLEGAGSVGGRRIYADCEREARKKWGCVGWEMGLCGVGNGAVWGGKLSSWRSFKRWCGLRDHISCSSFSCCITLCYITYSWRSCWSWWTVLSLCTWLSILSSSTWWTWSALSWWTLRSWNSDVSWNYIEIRYFILNGLLLIAITIAQFHITIAQRLISYYNYIRVIRNYIRVIRLL